MGDAGMESGYDRVRLSKDLDCSESDTSEDSGELLNPSEETGRRTAKFWELRKTGLPFRLRPSLDGLPGAPVGSLSLTCFGTTNWQFSQTSGSESSVVLGLLLWKLPSEEGKLGKYGLWIGERGLVGGVSKGDERVGRRASSFSGG